MILPDLRIITEVILYCCGFQYSTELATKLVRISEFATKQLGSRTHYDFGLRALKVVVEKAGNLKLLATGIISPTSDEIEEAEAELQQYLKSLLPESKPPTNAIGLRNSRTFIVKRT
mmetsp:Transcript_12591/g.19609  ORF Transcript_12591/g.19609 Transcript_12591/m.19609 type:complete len:117 (+) Transcript_12591:933-1283(+)